MSGEGGRSAGRGTPAGANGVLEGLVREVNAPGDVLDLLDGTPDDLIVLMHTAGATSLSPLFGEITGIICTQGSEGSHVAILSRDFGIPCIVSAELSEPDLDGRRVRMDPSGEITIVDGS